MVFLEQHVDFPIGKRLDRWLAAFNSSAAAYLPLVMVDSGHQISSGSKPDFKVAYRTLVNTELVRPPQAEIEAYARQVGSRVRVYARVVNETGRTLSTARNDATVHALVWEDARVGVTGRYVRAAPWAGISTDVASGGELTTTLETPDLASVNWNALHTVVLADYVPGPGPAYDMLQAALAQPVAITADPGSVTVAIEANDRQDRRVPIRLRGPYILNWTPTADVPWITVSPDAGPIAAQPTVIVAAQRLSPGWQHGVVTFTASSEDGMSLAQTLPVSAFSGPRVLRVGTGTASAGSDVVVSVALTALGDENAVSLSVAFDPAVLTNPSVVPGADAGDATLTSDDSQAAEGRLGLSLALPSGQTFKQGDAQLLVISFDTVPGGPSPVVLYCSDEPVARAIAGTDSGALQATYQDGAVLLTETAPVRAARRRLDSGGR